MAYEYTNKPMPWNNAGEAPPASLVASGLRATQKIPDDLINYYFNNNQKCIEELQAKLSAENDENEVATIDEIDEALGLTDIETNYTVLSRMVDELIEEEDKYIEGDVSSPELITFTIRNVQYTAESGMTWGEWLDSDYNTQGFYQDDYGFITTGSETLNPTPSLSDVINEGDTFDLEMAFG